MFDVSLLEVVAFWIPLSCFVSCCVGCWLAIRFRNQPTAGTWLGFLLGPIGWLIVFALPDNRITGVSGGFPSR